MFRYTSQECEEGESMYFQVIVSLLLFVLLAVCRASWAEEFALYVDSSSNVGVGTGTPLARLHVLDEVEAKLQIENTGSALGTQVMLNLINSGGVRFDMLDSSTGSNWVFQNQFGSFDVTLAGTGTREFRFYPNGNLELSGSLIQASSREIKNSITSVDQQSVLDRVVALPINTWSYKKEQGVTHMGPMAEDFYESFGLGSTDKGIASVDTGGVALAAIQGMKKEKDIEIAALKAELKAQKIEYEERLLRLEMNLSRLLSNHSGEFKVSSAN